MNLASVNTKVIPNIGRLNTRQLDTNRTHEVQHKTILNHLKYFAVSPIFYSLFLHLYKYNSDVFLHF